MKPGEYLFNHTEHIAINKPFIDGLFASALYFEKDKYILEVLAPGDMVCRRADCDGAHMNLGDIWERNILEAVGSCDF